MDLGSEACVNLAKEEARVGEGREDDDRASHNGSGQKGDAVREAGRQLRGGGRTAGSDDLISSLVAGGQTGIMRHTVALLCSLAALDPVSASVLSRGSQIVPSLRRNDLRALRFRGGATCSTPNVPARNPSLHASLPAVEIPTELRLLLGSAGIFLSFSVFAVLQEDVYKKSYGGEFFASTFFALLIERGINALVAFVGVAALGKSGLRIPHVDIFKSGISQMLAMAASNEALRYVSYPTQERTRRAR
ncbi:hypothetical protein AB1Y20_009764 [Prymnesium parvum]|uniref:Uncharacterized protein n=1 Tax=Prymnesium parvum TaxID=97485 RepID=A0AB34K6U8_PRYPA